MIVRIFNALFSGLLLALPAHALVIEVASQSPYSTIEDALQVARDWRGSNAELAKKEGITIRVKPGRYELQSPVVIEPRDSGSAEAPLVIEASDPANPPVFSGGSVIRGWKRDASNPSIWVTDLAQQGLGDWKFQELWINGKRAQRAKSPNRGYFYTDRPALANYDQAPPMGSPQFRAFFTQPTTVKSLAEISEQERASAEVVVYHNWQISRHRVEFFDPKTGYLQFTEQARWPFMKSESRQRFHIENVRSSMDQPGEWYLDSSGKLFYWAHEKEDLTTAEVVAPRLSQWLEMRGDPAKKQWVEHVHLKHLKFNHSGFLLPREGHQDSQADSKVSGSVVINGGRHVILEGVELAHTGNYALWFKQGSSDSKLIRSHLHDLGAGGVRIGEAPHFPNPDLRTQRITVDNNIIQNGGRYFMGSVGVFIQNSGENHVTYNDIGDFYYSGISAGWVWGYGESFAHRNRIEYNHIHHLGYRVLSDMGGFYGLGVASGTVVSNNHIHDISAYSYGGWGLYTDEGSSGILMENNLVYKTRHAGFHQHYGKDNIIRNNIFAFGEEAQVQRTRNEEHHSFTFANNVVYFDSGTLLYGSFQKPKARMERNLYFDRSGREIRFGEVDFKTWQAQGYDYGSRIVDPLFENVETLDFRLKPSSPAFDLGFKAFDFNKAGVYGDPEWKALANKRTYPKTEIFPVPGFVLEDGFETTPVNAGPFAGQYRNSLETGSVSVSEERARNGKRSLKFQDASNLLRGFDPHLSYRPRYQTGIARLKFSMYIDEATQFLHEWRTEGHPYHTGPALRIRYGELRLPKRDAIKLEPRSWYDFELNAPLGEHRSGQWSLQLIHSEGKVQSFEALPLQHPEFSHLDGIYFISEAQSDSAFYLDDIKISNDP